jgi:hypothetical protein
VVATNFISILTRKGSENRQAKSRKEEKPYMPKPEKQEDMPQHQHCPHAKRREDKNPKYHEEHDTEDFARILAAHPPKIVEREHK